MIQNGRVEKEGCLTVVKNEADGRARRQKDLFAFFLIKLLHKEGLKIEQEELCLGSS